MTEGEKMVWASTYATQRVAGHEVLDCVRMAWAAVYELSGAHSEVDATFGYGEAREMYDAIMGYTTYHDYS